MLDCRFAASPIYCISLETRTLMESTLREATEELNSLRPPFNLTRRGFVQTSLGAGLPLPCFRLPLKR